MGRSQSEQFVGSSPHTDAGDRNAECAGDVERLTADRTGGSEDDDGSQPSNPIVS